ncbi:MAG: Fe-S cluster assembly ATPase SufC [Actinomycetota bacterium]|nr:Fe-S cluster assembly ATPase SufC [Actinomycetota bacterium]
MSVLKISDLHASVAGIEILRGVDLEVRSGEVHALMGPNGSGKSTLSHALMGRGDYEVTSGSVTIDGVELLGLPTWQRAHAGLFLAMQYPVEVPGVPLEELVGASLRARSVAVDDLSGRVLAEARTLGVPDELLVRGVNDEFSGGEKKRAETVQLAVLEPKFAVLDEIDSGLDVDALRDVARRVEQLTNERGIGVLAITHYARLLTELKPDQVHVLLAGRVVLSGGPELADRLEETGYEGIAAEVGVDELTVEMPKEHDPFGDPTIGSSPFADPLA